MKKRIYYTCLVLAVAGLSSCATSKQKTTEEKRADGLTYANSWQLQGYPQVHERPPIN